MNRLNAASFLGIFFLFASNIGFTQSRPVPDTTIIPYKIAVSFSKTTNLIFPYAIKSVDRGSSAVIVQKAKGVENILQAKAGRKDFEPTNISIVTADGQFYSFVLTYSEQPSTLNLNFAGSDPVLLTGQLTNAYQLEKESWQVLGESSSVRLQRNQQDLRLLLNGVYHSKNALWFKLKLYNDAPLNFQPAYVRFFLRDKKRTKRTARQEIEIIPIYTPSYQATNGESSAIWPVAFKPFTIPKHQQLIIQIGDESGGRVIHLVVKSKFLLMALKLPS